MDVVRFTLRMMIICAITCMFSSCENGSNAVDVGDLVLPATVDLHVGQSIFLTDVDVLITFDSTLIDNRSRSEDGTVVGYAFISISFHPFFGPSIRQSLYTAEGPQKAEWEQYRILLVALNPLPQTGVVITSKAYVATIEISHVVIL